MTTASLDWHETVAAKLVKVMGQAAGRQVLASVLAEVGLELLSSSAEVKRFAVVLAKRGGLASAIAGMLTLHATMYESVPPTPSSKIGEG